ncbi:hypothetical protein NFI96_009162, partial [Prochilodus magdalenae]
MCCNCPGGADGVIPCPCVASRALLGEGEQELRPTRAPPAAGIEQRQAGQAGHLDSERMEAVAEELRAGSRIPVTIDQIVNDTLVVTLTYRERNYTGILLDCNKKTGLFCLPDVVGKSEEPFISKQECEVLNEEPCSKPPIQSAQRPKDENTEPEKPPCTPLPVPWVPQPPPRPIKRKKRRSREPGRMTMSTIRLRPRQVLCEKCKNTLTSDEDSKDGSTVAKPSRKENAPQGEDNAKESLPKGQKKEDGDSTKESKRREDTSGYESKSTPQGKGEVMKIPSRVHGSVKPFCPKQLMQNGEHDSNREPKKDIPSPKIRLRSRGEGEERMSVYEAELVGDPRRRSPRAPGPTLPKDSSEEKNPLELWSGSSGEEGERHGDLTLLINFRKRKADSSSLSVCSSDSLDESKSFSSDGTSPELCDLAPGDVSSSSSTREGQSKTVPPLTVRLHTRSMSKCVTEEGHAVTVGDVVWGKIHGFPWWPARVLSISGSRRDEAEVDAPWPEAKVSWFGSPTTSQLSVAKLSPFREFFRLRFNRKKKGMYRRAIIEAAKAEWRLKAEAWLGFRSPRSPPVIPSQDGEHLRCTQVSPASAPSALLIHKHLLPKSDLVVCHTLPGTGTGTQGLVVRNDAVLKPGDDSAAQDALHRPPVEH